MGVSSHQYARDTQFNLHDPAATVSSMIERILKASDALDRLRINQDKTQHVWLGSRTQLSKTDSESKP